MCIRDRDWAACWTSEGRGSCWAGCWTWRAPGSWLSVGLKAGLLGDETCLPGSGSVGWGLLGSLGLQREGVDRAADLRAEDLVDEPVLLDPAASLERRGGDGRAEVIAPAGVVLDLLGTLVANGDHRFPKYSG